MKIYAPRWPTPPSRRLRMRLTRSPSRRAAMILAAGGLIVGMQFVPALANAAPTSISSDSAATLAGQLGARSAGAYFDAASKQTVITVTDAAAASAVRAAGAVPRFVTHSSAQLAQVSSD